MPKDAVPLVYKSKNLENLDNNVAQVTDIKEDHLFND
jgi:hypothetical protein